MKKLKLRKGEILVLRTVNEDMTSHGGFKWPARGKVTCPDWKYDDACGHGLHGLPWGVGGNYCSTDADVKWLVVVVSTREGLYSHGSGDMNDKCKFASGRVVYCGAREGALALIQANTPTPGLTRWGSITASGTRGQATASGYAGQATASGNAGQATASGNAGQATASGNDGQATASGDAGQATASGDDAIASSHYTACGGYGGLLVIFWWDGKRNRAKVGYVGEDKDALGDTLAPGLTYALNDKHEFCPQ